MREADIQAKAVGQVLETAEELRWKIGQDIHEELVEKIYQDAAGIADRVVTRISDESKNSNRFLDSLVTNRITGIPIMIILLTIILWITVIGANYPSSWLSELFLGVVHPFLKGISDKMSLLWWLDGFLLDGIYLATAWVISVMLPPMAIFFPLFTLLEDFGYLPRVAFNLDNFFKKTGAHGKQALSMVMGFGCNAAGIVSTRIIDSPRERLLAIITNNFSLCNGRWPTQILLASIFLGNLVPPYLMSFISAASVVLVALLGILLTLALNWVLSKTLLSGELSTFSLELPPYRPPRIWQTIYTSLIDRTLIVLWRAVVFAVPAGAIIWLSANINIGGKTAAEHLIDFLNPLGLILGMNGVILVAYIFAIPANEIVIPTILMLTVLTTGAGSLSQGAGVMFELDSASATGKILVNGGWTTLTAINVMIFSLIHNPCSTTIYTIFRETGSKKWTLVATIIPLLMGFFITFLITQVWWLVDLLIG